MSVLIRQAKIVDPQSEFHNKVVDILIENGAVSNIASSLNITADQIVEAAGLYAASGFVDVFADYREPGYEHKETIATGLKAAAAGGFTDVLLSPNTNPAVSTKSIVQFIAQKAKGNIVSVHPLGSITQDIEGKALAEMLDMHANGAVAFTDGWKPVQNANLMLKALEYAKSFDGVLLEIPLDASLAAGGLMHEGAISTKLGMAGIPVLAETILIYRDLELLRYTDSKLHITGVSTAEGLAMIRGAKKEGLNVTCSVTPYHLALTDEALTTYNSVYKVTPVLRSKQDRKALIDGLKDGTIDCIASHHRPQEWDSKAKEFEYAGEGMNIQEIAFNIVLEAVENEVSVERLIDAFALRPRKIFGLPANGIEKGGKSFTLFTTEGKTQLAAEKVQSTSRNNPYIGKELKGKIVGIFNNDQLHLNQ
ncbi:MAG TPA: dihydroorotase [Flavipsychrobacter sp.]|nr:dihydroorotase [Flavipsychrobacter sp.]